MRAQADIDSIGGISGRGLGTKRLKRRVTFWLNRIGWPGIAGATLLAFHVAFQASAIGQMEAQLAELKRSALAITAQARQARDPAHTGMDTPTGQLAVFYRAFPEPKSVPDWLEAIYLAAQEQSLRLDQGEYRATREPSGRLTRFQIMLPVKGSYVQIRRFAASVLSRVPTLSLDSVKFERQKIADGGIEAKIGFTLYLVDGP